MNVIFIGASRRTGTSKKTGNPYDMCKLSYSVPIQPKTTPDYQYTGTGHEVKEIDLDPACMPDLSVLKPGQSVILGFTPDPRNPRINICSSVAPK